MWFWYMMYQIAKNPTPAGSKTGQTRQFRRYIDWKPMDTPPKRARR
eukprot:gene2816-20189_t